MLVKCVNNNKYKYEPFHGNSLDVPSLQIYIKTKKDLEWRRLREKSSGYYLQKHTISTSCPEFSQSLRFLRSCDAAGDKEVEEEEEALPEWLVVLLVKQGCLVIVVLL